MKSILIFFVIIVVAFTSGYEFSKIREEKVRCREISESRKANLDFTLNVLEKMRGGDNDAAMRMLEIGLLVDLPGLADEENVIGWNDSMQAVTMRVAAYCKKYNVFDSNTNLPSHIVAKQFLVSHRVVAN